MKENLTKLTKREIDILHVARVEFESVGYYKTNVESIASKLNIGKATIYRHFGNKSDLFFYTLMLSIKENFINLENSHNIEDPYRALNFCINEYFNSMWKMNPKKNKNNLMYQAMIINDVKDNMILHFKAMRKKIIEEVGKIIFNCLEKSGLPTYGTISISSFIVGTLSIYLHAQSVYEEFDKKARIDELKEIKEFIFRGLGIAEDEIKTIINENNY